MSHRDELIEKIQSAPTIVTDAHVGLSKEQVENLEKEGLENKTKKNVTKTYWQIICDNVLTFFNIIYFVMIVLMVIAGMDITNYFFCIPVLCNMIIGLFTDLNTRRLVDKLRLVTDPRAKVVREGKEIEIPTNKVVLNDVMVVSSGEQICADAEIIEGKVEMDESLLTGESIKVSKGIGEKVLSATYVKSGKAYVRVSAVGAANYCESIQAGAKQFKRPNSELKSSCLKIFWTTGALAILLGLVMVVSWVIRMLAEGNLNYGAYQEFIVSLSGSMIAMIPAGLYLLVSLTLAVSVGRLAQKKMNVQELYCVEMLARVDTICFDKTGTITDGKLSLNSIDTFSSFKKDELGGYITSIIKKAGDDNQTAKCLVSSLKHSDEEPLFVLPFDSDKKYAAGYFDGIGSFVYGAPEFIEGDVSFEAQEELNALTKEGFRVLGIFFTKEKIKENNKISDLKLVGIISLTDHVKDDAKKNIEWFTNNGVDVKIISGDNAATVSHIAKVAGVPEAEKYISMENVTDDKIPSIASEYTVFGRVKPEQKANIIAALQAQGHKVAMTGDGVNDILALKKADCSIAMGSGSSAARNVAHIVSINNDFSKLPDVVAEGRRAINNLQRSASLFLAKTIFAVVLTAIFIFSQICGGISYPFAPKNLYVWEIITIGGAGFFLALQKTNDPIKDTFMHNVLRRALPGGIVQILAVLIVYLAEICNPEFIDLDQAKAVAVFSFTILSYCVLARVSWKFDKYRGFIFGFLLVCGLGFFIFDFFFGTKIVSALSHGSIPPEELVGIFGLRYDCLNWTHILFCICVTISLVGLYFLLTWYDARYLSKNLGRDDYENKSRS